MKNRVTIVMLASMLSFAFETAKGQGGPADVSAFLQASTSDANKLIGAYIEPAVKGFSYGMTSGWFNTAKTHKIGGVDLGVSISAVMLPTADQTFDPTKLKLTTVTPSLNSAPTIIGPKTTGPNGTTCSYTISNNGATLAKVDSPEGLDLKGSIGMNAIPVPIIQLGVGLIKSTDLKIRYLPEQKSGDSKVKMLGFGLMHDIKQHIPGVKSLPFDLSVLVAYNSISGSTSLINTRLDPNPPYNGYQNEDDGVPYSKDGMTNYKLNSWTLQALISKKVAVLTFYAGVGYAAVSTKASITGSFVLDNPIFNGAPNPTPPIVNPFSTTYSNNGLKLTAGMRLKLGPIYFNGDYTVQKFNALTVGFGLAIR